MRMFITRLLPVALLAATGCAQNTEIPKTIEGSIAPLLATVEGQFLGVAEAMPESKYSFVPTAGKFDDVRSFSEQVKHVACAHFAFFNQIDAKTPPGECEKGGLSKASTKAELIQYLRASFDYGNGVLATITDQNALARVDGRYSGPNTRLGMAVTAVWHITDHYGQLVEYLRMNGLAPPATQPYRLRVP